MKIQTREQRLREKLCLVSNIRWKPTEEIDPTKRFRHAVANIDVESDDSILDKFCHFIDSKNKEFVGLDVRIIPYDCGTRFVAGLILEHN